MQTFKKKSKPSPHNPTLGADMIQWYGNEIIYKGRTRNKKQWWTPCATEPNWATKAMWNQVRDPNFNPKRGSKDLCNYFAREMIDKMQSGNLVSIAERIIEWHSEYKLPWQKTRWGTDGDWLLHVFKTFQYQPNNITIPKHIEFNGSDIQVKHSVAMIMCDTIDRLHAQGKF